MTKLRSGPTLAAIIVSWSCLLAGATCVIVNLAVERRLSWAVLVLVCLLYSLAVCSTALLAQRARLAKAILVGSLLLLPFLGALQLTLTHLMHIPGAWFSSIAVPVSLLWLAVIWLWLLVVPRITLNGYRQAAFLFLLGSPAAFLTNWFSSGADPLALFGAVINGVGLLFVSGLLFLISIGFGRERA